MILLSPPRTTHPWNWAGWSAAENSILSARRTIRMDDTDDKLTGCLAKKIPASARADSTPPDARFGHSRLYLGLSCAGRQRYLTMSLRCRGSVVMCSKKT